MSGKDQGAENTLALIRCDAEEAYCLGQGQSKAGHFHELRLYAGAQLTIVTV
jgi:hypothetical protein